MDVEKENKIPILEQSFFLIKNLNLSPWITSPCLAVTTKSLNSSTLQPSSSAWYESENYFGIKLVSGPDFNPNDYFDILRNNWKLDGLPQKIAEAQSLCIGPDEIKRT